MITRYRTVGGNLDFYVFSGSSYQEVIRQYHSVIGKPKMLPAWAHGFFVRSPAFTNSSLVIEAIDRYNQLGFPLQGISLSENVMNGYRNFEYLKIANDVN